MQNEMKKTRNLTIQTDSIEDLIIQKDGNNKICQGIITSQFE